MGPGGRPSAPLSPSPFSHPLTLPIPLTHPVPPRIVFVFLDGVGLGPDDAGENPFAGMSLKSFEALAGGQRWTGDVAPLSDAHHVFRPLDATLDMPGLPQSGTGQASLLSGVNCAQVAGRHFGPYPHSQTKPVLARHNLFRRIRDRFPDRPEPVAFANAYPPRFFEMVRRRDRWTVTTLCCLQAGVPVRDAGALLAGRAITAGLTGKGWETLVHPPPPVLSEEEAGVRLATLARSYDLTLFEYFLTDKAGHRRSPEEAAAVLHALDRFFAGLCAHLDPLRDLLLITSDHGNLEDLSTRTHTRNPVPLVALGPGADRFRQARSIVDVTPIVVEVLAG